MGNENYPINAMQTPPELPKNQPQYYGRRQADIITPSVLGSGVIAFMVVGQQLISPLSTQITNMSIKMTRFENVIYRVDKLEKAVDNLEQCKR